MSRLFSSLAIRGVTFKNRAWVSPMCQYSATEGVPTDWHLVHLGSRAVGGAGIVMAEATGVSPEGRISPFDTGIWNDVQVEAWSRITRFIREQGSVPAIQIAHAGRKASTDAPWRGGKALPPEKGGWQPIAPTAEPFAPGDPVPREMTAADIDLVERQFVEAAQRSLAAGFDVLELHMAHGYLLHEFLSPLANKRPDDFGGSLENRLRFPLRVAAAARNVWPEDRPLFVRISASDWVEGGWDLPQSIEFARRLKALGVDLIDCSSGGAVPKARIPVSPGYQVPFAEAIRREVGIATGAVGLIVKPDQAEEIIATGKADAVLLAREMLRNPYWPIYAARALDVELHGPSQYLRVFAT